MKEIKEHFVKIAMTIVGEKKSEEILSCICNSKGINARVKRKMFAELKMCKLIDTKNTESFDKITEITYG